MAKREIRLGKSVKAKESSLLNYEDFSELSQILRGLTTNANRTRTGVKPEFKKNGNWFQLVRSNEPIGRRINNEHVIAVCALVYDIDGTLKLSDAIQSLKEKNVRFIAYTSFSHQIATNEKSGEDRFRIVLDVSEDIPVSQFKQVYIAVGNDLFGPGKWDQATNDPGRLWLAATDFTDVKSIWHENLDGTPIDPTKLALKSTSSAAPLGKRASCSISEMLKLLSAVGCVVTETKDQFTYLRRPGKSEGQSMSVCVNEEGEVLLHVFTTNFPPFESGKTYGLRQAKRLLVSTKKESNQGDEKDDNKKLLKLSQEAMKEGRLELWVDTQYTPYATFVFKERKVHHMIDSEEFQNWLVIQRLDDADTTASTEEIKACRRSLKAIAAKDGAVYEIFNRIAHVDGNIYVDIHDESGNIVKITQEGWSVEPSPDNVRFKKSSFQRAIPLPETGGTVGIFSNWFGLSGTNEQLIIGWMIASFMKPVGGFPILNINGEQGSGKTLLSEIIKKCLDPSNPALTPIPKKEEDVVIVARALHIVAIDNLSHISNQQSDQIAMLATGAGSFARKLYTDESVSAVSAHKAILMNGISNVSRRPDLIERSLFVNLAPISPDSRRSSSEINKLIDQEISYFLGALYNRVSSALRNIEKSNVENSHRLMDMLNWVASSEEDDSRGNFASALTKNTAEANSNAYENSPVAQAIYKLISESGSFEGVASYLLDQIRVSMNIEPGRPLPHGYPQTAPALGAEIRRIEPLLRNLGIGVDRIRSGAERTLKIDYIRNHGLTLHQAHEVDSIDDMAEREEMRDRFLKQNGVSDSSDR